MVQITNHWHHNHSNSNFINQSFDPNHSPFRISSPSQVIATLQPPRAVVAAGLVGRREFLDPHTLNIDLITLNVTYLQTYKAVDSVDSPIILQFAARCLSLQRQLARDQSKLQTAFHDVGNDSLWRIIGDHGFHSKLFVYWRVNLLVSTIRQ